MKKNAKARMKKRSDRFVVGYILPGNWLYGRGASFPSRNTMLPLTRKKAEKQLATMPSAGCAIFELVPVEVNR